MASSFSPMQIQSLGLTVVLVVIVLFTGAIIAWGGARQGGWSPAMVKRTRWITVAAAVLVAVYGYTMDAGMRRITLFETEGPWDEVVSRAWTFEVAHPGVEHRLHVAPRRRSWRGNAFDVEAGVELVAPDGERLVSEWRRYARQGASKSTTGASWDFVPRVAGTHLLRVEGNGQSGLRLLLRVEDPDFQDGIRAPGY